MAQGHGTPESDYSIECFQNYTAPEVFIQGLAGIVNQGDVESMIRAQKQMLQRFEKTNEMLINCNALSAGRLKTAGAEFKKHTQLLLEMKKDLDYIFKKIRAIKTKLNAQYPQAFAEAIRSSLAEEAEEDEEAESVSLKPEENVLDKKKDIDKDIPVRTTPKIRPHTIHVDNSVEAVSLNSKEDNFKRNQMQSCISNSNSSSTDHSNHSNESSDCTSDTG